LSSTPTTPGPEPEPRLRRLVLLVGAVILVDTMFFAAVTPLLPDYVDDLNLSKAAAGVLSASYAVGAVLGSLPAGWLASRWGVRPTILLGLAVVGASSIAFGFVQNVVLLDAARFVQGIGGAGLWAGGMGWLMGAAPRDRRAELMGGALGVAIVGTLLGPAVGALASVAGTGPTFTGVALIAGSLAVVALRTPAPPTSDLAQGRQLARALRSRVVAVGMWLIFLPSLAFGVLTVVGSLRLAELGASALAIGGVWVVASSFEAILAPFAGRIADRRGALWLTRYGLAAATVVTLLIPLAGAAFVLAAVIWVTSPSYGTLWVPGMALISEGAESSGLDQTYAFAIFNLVWAAAQMTGSAGGATLAQATSDTVPYLAIAGLFLATLIAVARRRAIPT
jgi:MFS family permease